VREWKLDIGGDEWAVQFVAPSRIPKTLVKGKLEQTWGRCIQKTHTIQVANNLKPEDETLVLGHEIAHARCWDLDEEAVEELAEAINAAFWRSVNAK